MDINQCSNRANIYNVYTNKYDVSVCKMDIDVIIASIGYLSRVAIKIDVKYDKFGYTVVAARDEQ